MKASGLYEVVREEDTQEVVWRVFVDAVRSSGLTERDLVHVSEGTIKALAFHAGFGVNSVVLAKLILQWRVLREVLVCVPEAPLAAMPPRRSPTVESYRAYSPNRINMSPIRTHHSPSRSPAANVTPLHRRTPSPCRSPTNSGAFTIEGLRRKPCFSARKALGDRGRVAQGMSPEGVVERRSGRRLERVAVPALPPYKHCVVGDGPPFPIPHRGARSVSPSGMGGVNTFDRTMTNHISRPIVNETPKKGRAYSASPDLRHRTSSKESRVRTLDPQKKHASSLTQASVVISSPQSVSPISKRVGYAQKGKIYGSTAKMSSIFG